MTLHQVRFTSWGDRCHSGPSDESVSGDGECGSRLFCLRDSQARSRAAQRSEVVAYCADLFHQANGDRDPEVLQLISEATRRAGILPGGTPRDHSGRISHEIRLQYAIGFP